ncbi:UNVERIFIED_CONTAM: hypothetical protein Sradi_3671900 [Sesamum radiatum]|uniref:Uncharacterized protein n=1 Tax=Sesamum radiatum TaxID=300843 RepID=A0AAW2QJ25_SESRA
MIAIARPYFKHGFAACEDQFLTHGYPPNGEDPSFIDFGAAMENAPNPFARMSTPIG